MNPLPTYMSGCVHAADLYLWFLDFTVGRVRKGFDRTGLLASADWVIRSGLTRTRRHTIDYKRHPDHTKRFSPDVIVKDTSSSTSSPKPHVLSRQARSRTFVWYI